MAASSITRGIQKKNSKNDVYISSVDHKKNSIQTSSSTTSTTEVRMNANQKLSAASRDPATSASISTACGPCQSELSLGAQMEGETVQRRVSKSRAHFQNESRFESRREDSGDDPSLAELKTQLDEYRGMPILNIIV